MKTKQTRKLLALVLALVMVAGLLPTAALADDPPETVTYVKGFRTGPGFKKDGYIFVSDRDGVYYASTAQEITYKWKDSSAVGADNAQGIQGVELSTTPYRNTQNTEDLLDIPVSLGVQGFTMEKVDYPLPGGGGGYVPATYSVTVDKADNGSVSVNPKSAAKGATVTITVKPDEGYELDTLKVVDKNGDKVKLTEKDGKYTFTMPASKVTVTGTFAEIEQPMVNPFIDVKESDYFYNAVMWAVKSGVTKGTSATTFSPGAVCTRAQMVTFLYRFFVK